MSGDIVERLRNGTPTAVYVIANDAADEIERLRAERDAERMRVRAEMARRGLLCTQLLPYFDSDTEKVVVPTNTKMTLTQVWEFLAWLDKETEARRER